MSKKNRTPKRLTKRERKALEGKGKGPPPAAKNDEHIHCIACGKHLHAEQFTGRPSTARYLRCRHGHRFASCTGCVSEAKRRLDQHDRSGGPVEVAPAWH